MEGSSSASGAKPAGRSKTTMIIAIVVVVIIIVAAAAVLLYKPSTPEPTPTNWLDKGFKLEIYYNSGNAGRQQACQILKTNLESLNPGKIVVTVTAVEWAKYLELQQAGKMPVFFVGWAPDYADPQDYVQPFYRSGGAFAPYIGYSNATLDAKIDAAAAQLDPDLRALQYKQISMDMYKEAVYIWCSQATNFFAARAWISGYYFNPMYSNLYYYALDKISTTRPDTFIYGEISGNPQYLDPAIDYETAGGEVLQNVLETLIWYDGASAANLIPMLSLNVPTVADGNLTTDGLHYTYHIREGVKFHSNDTLTAYDVAFSIERAIRLNDPHGPVWMIGEIMIPNFYSYKAGTFDAGTGALVGGVNNTTAINKAIWVKDMYTVQFNLTTPAPYFNAAMAYTVGCVLSKNNTMAHGGLNKTGYNWVNTNPIGTGPYKFTGFNSSQYITLQRWDGYWRTPAKIKNIILLQVADANSRILQLKNGDLDAAAIPRAQRESVMNVTGVTVISGFPTFSIDFMGLNQDIDMTGLDKNLNNIPSNFFADTNIRLAFAHALDCPLLIQTFWKNTAIQPNGAIPKGMFGYSADVPVFSFNLTLSKQLLKAAPLPLTGGIANSFKVVEMAAIVKLE